MIRLLVLFFLMGIMASLFPQPDQNLESYQYWREKGIDSYEAGQFEQAINELKLARVMDDRPANHDLEQWIDKAYNGYVERLQGLVLSSERLASAYELEEQDPTFALQLAQEAYQINPDNLVARRLRNEIIQEKLLCQQRLVHSGGVSVVRFSPDGKWILTGTASGTISVWDREGKELRNWRAHDYGVLDIAFSPDGNGFYSCGDAIVKKWSLEGELKQELAAHLGTVKRLLFDPQGRLLSMSNDYTICLWDESGSLVRRFMSNYSRFTDINLHPDGKQLWALNTSGELISWPYPGTHEWESRQTWRPENSLGMIQMEWIPGTDSLVTTNHRGVLSIRDSAWKIDQSFPLLTSREQYATARKIQFFPNGRRLLAIPSIGTRAFVSDLSGIHVQVLAGHTQAIQDFDISADGNWIATASLDGDVRVWKTTTTHLASLSTKDRYIAARLSQVRPDLYLYSDRALQKWQVNPGKIPALHFKDSIHLAQSINPSSSRLSLDTEPSDSHLVVRDFQSFVLVDQEFSRAWPADKDTYRWLRSKRLFHPIVDPTFAYVAGFENFRDSTLQILSLDALKNQEQIPTHPPLQLDGKFGAMAFSPDGNTLAIGMREGLIHLYSLGDSSLKTFTAHQGAIEQMSFSTNGSYLLSHDGNQAKRWTLEGDELGKYEGLANRIEQGITSADGTYLLLVSRGQSEWVDLQDRSWMKYRHGQGIRNADISPDQDFILFTDFDQYQVILHYTPQGYLKHHQLPNAPYGSRLAHAALNDADSLEQLSTPSAIRDRLNHELSQLETGHNPYSPGIAGINFTQRNLDHYRLALEAQEKGTDWPQDAFTAGVNHAAMSIIHIQRGAHEVALGHAQQAAKLCTPFAQLQDLSASFPAIIAYCQLQLGQLREAAATAAKAERPGMMLAIITELWKIAPEASKHTARQESLEKIFQELQKRIEDEDDPLRKFHILRDCQTLAPRFALGNTDSQLPKSIREWATAFMDTAVLSWQQSIGQPAHKTSGMYFYSKGNLNALLRYAVLHDRLQEAEEIAELARDVPWQILLLWVKGEIEPASTLAQLNLESRSGKFEFKANIRINRNRLIQAGISFPPAPVLEEIAQ